VPYRRVEAQRIVHATAYSLATYCGLIIWGDPLPEKERGPYLLPPDHWYTLSFCDNVTCLACKRVEQELSLGSETSFWQDWFK
jgi:hypothetical protein